MKNASLLIIVLLTISCMNQKPKTEFVPIEVTYPIIEKDSSVVEDYHGQEIADPYRWLEDDNSEETADWVNAQNNVTFNYLKQIPFREAIKDRLTELWNYEKSFTPFKKGDFYYFFKNDGLQNQNVLYRTTSLEEEEKLVIDPNKFSEDGTASLAGFGISDDSKYMAYQVSEGGSDWRKIYVMDLETGNKLDDVVEWVKFSGVSMKDHGFYYSRYPEPKAGNELDAKNEYHQIWYHKIGTAQSSDVLVFENPDHPQRNSYGQTTDDENYLVTYTSESTSGNELRVKNITAPGNSMIQLTEGFDSDYSVIESEGSKLFIMTNKDAPNWKLMAVDVSNASNPKWSTIIPEAKEVLSGVSINGGKLIARFMKNASSLIQIYDLDGKKLSDFELPGIGSVSGFSGKKDEAEAFYSFTSFTRPSTIYKVDMSSLKSEVYRKSGVKFDSDAYVTEQVWYTSKDGTKVPMFVTHKKGVKMDGSNPTLLYGYGGFDISLTPGFNLTRTILLENGGVYAVANLRGGGEFGKEWHLAGTKERKQNVFDDFQAAAEHLIEAGYTSSDKLAIQGGSNGGLLVGASMTQRPDLFKVALPAVGVLDMLRYHKFTIGWAWAEDYGRSDDPEAFKYLYEYSPLHNVKPADYPATLVTTADHDDRVVPAHSFKFISELQDKHTGDNPVLIRVETSAGHGAGKPTSKRIEEAADMLSFMFYNFGEDVKYEREVKN